MTAPHTEDSPDREADSFAIRLNINKDTPVRVNANSLESLRAELQEVERERDALKYALERIELRTVDSRGKDTLADVFAEDINEIARAALKGERENE